ncbi:MAG: hypothetical protein J5878_07325 [Oscillospiraceae bacterium]|nr:hypothetical protein [Oscillospiraceae bacterium]
MDWLELPSKPEGSVQEQIEQIWTYLFRLAEGLMAQRGTGETGGRQSP